jgi:hypothetical protein
MRAMNSSSLARSTRHCPRPPILIASSSLLRTSALLWVQSPVQVGLGTARLAGQLVALRARVRQVAWDFGDGATGSTVGPGKAYTRADPCAVKVCPHYFGHVYLRRGVVRITARVSWTGEFRVGAGPWRQIADAVTGAPGSVSIRIYEAHGELVPDPPVISHGN